MLKRLGEQSLLKLVPPVILLAIIVVAINALNDDDNTQAARPCAIVLHGLGRTSGSMSKIADALSDNGYSLWNETYPSRDKSVGELALQAIEPALAFCRNAQASEIHFVTHSLGGILVRYYLQDNRVPNLGRIVMLSPPNQGSEIVDRLKELHLFKRFLGPASLQLGTDKNSIPNQLDPIQGEIGIITGNASSDPWFSWLIHGEDDGKVSVASARLTEMKDFLIVSHGHTSIMRKDLVIKQILHFLTQGRFNHALQ